MSKCEHAILRDWLQSQTTVLRSVIQRCAECGQLVEIPREEQAAPMLTVLDGGKED